MRKDVLSNQITRGLVAYKFITVWKLWCDSKSVKWSVWINGSKTRQVFELTRSTRSEMTTQSDFLENLSYEWEIPPKSKHTHELKLGFQLIEWNHNQKLKKKKKKKDESEIPLKKKPRNQKTKNQILSGDRS